MGLLRLRIPKCQGERVRRVDDVEDAADLADVDDGVGDADPKRDADEGAMVLVEAEADGALAVAAEPVPWCALDWLRCALDEVSWYIERCDGGRLVSSTAKLFVRRMYDSWSGSRSVASSMHRSSTISKLTYSSSKSNMCEEASLEASESSLSSSSIWYSISEPSMASSSTAAISSFTRAFMSSSTPTPRRDDAADGRRDRGRASSFLSACVRSVVAPERLMSTL